MAKMNDLDLLSRLMSSSECRKKIRQIIREEGMNIDAQDECGNSLLHRAAKKGCLLEIELLLELGIYTGLRNKDGDIALEVLLRNIRGVNSKTIEVIQVLLKCATIDLEVGYVNGIDNELPFGKSLLEYAIESSNVEFAKLLVKCGAQQGINSRNKRGKNLLIQIVECIGNAAQQARHDLNFSNEQIFSTFDFSFIRLLVERGIDINGQDGCKLTALHQIVNFAFDIEIIKLLLELGANVNAKECDDVTPLHIAASLEGNNAELINLLIDHGADINAKTITLGHNPVHVAAACNNIQNIKTLLARGANIESRDKNQRTPLFAAVRFHLIFCKYNATSGINAIEHLINNGSDITATDINGQTVLFNLSLLSNLQATKLIMDKYKSQVKGNNGKIKKFISKKNKKGFDALDVALERGNKEFTLLLTSLGADVHDIDSKGYTRLHRAIIDNDVKAIKLLLMLKVDINAQDHFGNTPLHLAIQCKSSQKIINILLKKGADINICNHNEATPIDELCNKIRELGENNKYDELKGCFIRHMKERYNKDYRYYFQLISIINLAVIAYMFSFAKVLPPPITLVVLFSGGMMLYLCFNQWQKAEQYKIAEYKLTEGKDEQSVKISNEITNCEKNLDHFSNQGLKNLTIDNQANNRSVL